MHATESPAKLVKRYRAYIAKDPELFDGDIDVVMWLVNDTARTWTPSEVARVVKISTNKAHDILRELVKGKHIKSDERGAWTRYYGRHF